MSYIPANDNATKNAAILDRIFADKTVEQFIKEFNDSENINFFSYFFGACETFSDKIDGYNDPFHTMEVMGALLAHIKDKLAHLASAKIKKYAATEEAWGCFGLVYNRQRSFNASDIYYLHVNDLCAKVCSDEYADFKNYFNLVLALDLHDANSNKISQAAFKMYKEKESRAAQIELPALEF